MGLDGHRNIITQVEFNKEGEFLVTGGYDKTVRVWEVVNMSESKLLRGIRFNCKRPWL